MGTRRFTKNGSWVVVSISLSLSLFLFFFSYTAVHSHRRHFDEFNRFNPIVVAAAASVILTFARSEYHTRNTAAITDIFYVP